MNVYCNPNTHQTERVFPDQERGAYLRLDMNENVDGLPEDFVEDVKREITPDVLSTYPEPDRFVKKYASFLGDPITEENILTTNGTDMAIRYVLEVFGEKGKDVVTVSPSFEMYWVNCSLLGLHHVPVAYESNMTVDVNKILHAICEDTRIVVMLNPNNPIGDVFSREEAERIIGRAREVGALVVIDEAYHYYYPNTFVDLAMQEEHVLVLRTFSKLFSMAALRLGIVIGRAELIQELRKIRLTFDVNGLALLFGERLLDRPQMIAQMCARAEEGRAYLLETLQAHGYDEKDRDLVAGKGNYIFIRPKHSPQEVADQLKQDHHVLVHTMSHPLIREYIRVTIGSKEVMQRFVEAFFAVDDRK